MRSLTLLLLACCAPSLAFANDQTTLVDFESGARGWSGPIGPGGTSGLLPGLGNGGTTGLGTVFNDFGITFRNDSDPAFVGSYSHFDVVSFSVDVRVNEISFFGSPVSRNLVLELRDYDLATGGFPWTSVWIVLGTLQQSPTWSTFQVSITDTTSPTLPPGWGGYGAEDPTTFEPILPAGVTFADVLAGVDEVVLTTLEPGFFFGFTDFDVVLDNLTLTTQGGAWCEIPGGLAGAKGVPTLTGYGDLTSGSAASMLLGNAAPGATTYLLVGTNQIAFPLFGGTILTNPNVLVRPGTTDADGNQPFGFVTPPMLPPGLQYVSQYLVLDPTGPEGATLTNGLLSTTP